MYPAPFPNALRVKACLLRNMEVAVRDGACTAHSICLNSRLSIGGYGFGMTSKGAATGLWTQGFYAWLMDRGLLTSATK
jgi:hypothetical protein